MPTYTVADTQSVRLCSQASVSLLATLSGVEGSSTPSPQALRLAHLEKPWNLFHPFEFKCNGDKILFVSVAIAPFLFLINERRTKESERKELCPAVPGKLNLPPPTALGSHHVVLPAKGWCGLWAAVEAARPA